MALLFLYLFIINVDITTPCERNIQYTQKYQKYIYQNTHNIMKKKCMYSVYIFLQTYCTLMILLQIIKLYSYHMYHEENLQKKRKYHIIHKKKINLILIKNRVRTFNIDSNYNVSLRILVIFLLLGGNTFNYFFSDK